ncbi:adenosylmethionine decarboxylase [Trinickia sp. Y13]|uniref:adenosylmethionine decarboxylase n=1 Tax=Trinickia sp. Y13 TaxID=2917807 RepID=UPI002405A4A9|nr:adenosylmethionine decarboxylase [Trinickia sp. Y13]MDG0023636.1 adenosylmethionine decarboxylase [Trinickia sp. Y13]
MSESPHLAYGRHVLVDIAQADHALLNDRGALVRALTDAAVAEGATVLGTIEHAFEPNGVTILLLLAESHVSLHTYPDEGRAFFDAFTCGVRCEPVRIFRRFVAAHPVGTYRMVFCERGEAGPRETVPCGAGGVA